MPLIVSVELSSVSEYATAVPSTVTAFELLMTALSVDVGTTPIASRRRRPIARRANGPAFRCLRPIDVGATVVVACDIDGVARYAAADVVVDELLTVGLVDRQRGAAIARGTGGNPGQINRVAKDDIGYPSGECGRRIELERGEVVKIKIY